MDVTQNGLSRSFNPNRSHSAKSTSIEMGGSVAGSSVHAANTRRPQSRVASWRLGAEDFDKIGVTNRDLFILMPSAPARPSVGRSANSIRCDTNSSVKESDMTPSAKWLVLFLASIFAAFCIGNAWDSRNAVNPLDSKAIAAETAAGQWTAPGQLFDRLEWKDIPSSGRRVGSVLRAQVPGGWLILVHYNRPNTNSFGTGLTFVPDPEHAW